MPANVQTMAYYGEKPWHKMGTPVPEGVTAAEMIKAAGLDWRVEVVPARGARPATLKGRQVFSRYEVLRKARPNTTESDALLGVVSQRYQPLQNDEAFEFFDSIVGQGKGNSNLFTLAAGQCKATFETAGALGEGERIWVMARMPDAMTIVPGDDCLRYLLLSNTHTGNGSVIVKFTPVRVVCQNTLMLALDDGQTAYRVRHTRNMQFRLDELADFMALTQQIFLTAQEEFVRFAKIEMTEDRMEQFLEALYPHTEAQKKKNDDPPRWECVQNLFDGTPDLQLPGVRGTLWAAYNAVTRFEDYRQPKQGELPGNRLDRVWFGTGADTKIKALEAARKLAKAWSN